MDRFATIEDFILKLKDCEEKSEGSRSAVALSRSLFLTASFEISLIVVEKGCGCLDCSDGCELKLTDSEPDLLGT